MKLSEIKKGFLYATSVSPQEIVRRGVQVGHGCLLKDVVKGIYKCSVEGISPEYKERIQAIVDLVFQEMSSSGSAIKESYKTKISHLLEKMQKMPECKRAGQLPLVGRGLVNAGNTCYANSVLNLILLAPAFRGALAARTSPLGISLRDMQAALYQVSEWNSPLSCTSGPLFVALRELKKIFPNIASCRPQDAEEFLSCLLEHIGYCPTPLIISEHIEGHTSATKRRDESVISVRVMNLNDRLKRPSLQDLFDRSVETREVVREGEGSEVCVESKISFATDRRPSVLFVNLIRYSAHVDKDGTLFLDMDRRSVTIPEHLVVGAGDAHEQRYHLHGVVIHNSGHYVMLERTANGWVCHDDSRVFRVESSKALRDIDQHGVLFSYELIS